MRALQKDNSFTEGLFFKRVQVPVKSREVYKVQVKIQIQLSKATMEGEMEAIMEAIMEGEIKIQTIGDTYSISNKRNPIVALYRFKSTMLVQKKISE